jgi:hypothetical protein
MRTAGRYDCHNACVREGVYAKARGRRGERGVESTRRVSDAGSVLEAMVRKQRLF